MNSKNSRFLIVFLSIILLIGFFTGNISIVFAKSQSTDKAKNIEFKTVYPGVYGQYERELINRFQELFIGGHEEWNEKIKARQAGKEMVGDMRLQAFPALEGYKVTSDDLLSAAAKLNPLNPLYTDTEYAKKTKYRGLIAAPLAVDPAVGAPYPPKGTDIMPNSDDFTTGRGLDHEIIYYKPIYAGDILNSILTEQSFADISDPEGSKIRKLRQVGSGDVYNNRGEKVMTAVYRSVFTFKHFMDRSMADSYDKPLTFNWWNHYDWDRIRSRYVYTEADWDYIKDLWSKEYIRGADTLYWEDVKIGDEPIWTCDGPFTGGFRGTNNEHNSVRDILMNLTPKEIEAELYKDSFGIYRIKGGAPDNTMFITSDHPNARSSFMNTVGRGQATKFVTNWMGDDGWLRKIAWRLAFCWDEGHNMFPEDYDRPSYLLKVPYLKEQGKFLDTHGYDGDVGITKGYVCDKYVKDGSHYVDLVVWCETIDGYIWAECYAVVELPSREHK